MLYSEIHFRFGGISPSLLFRKEPEIIFDLPARCAPGRRLPLTLLLHDIHHYPITPLSVNISIFYRNREIKKISFDEMSEGLFAHPHSKVCEAYLFQLDTADFPQDAYITFLPSLTYQQGDETKEVAIDNLIGNSKLPLTCFMASQTFPKQEQTLYGDMHCHSLHTRDHVEFGAPLQSIASTAEALGLDVTTVIDHSYDLSCKPEQFLERDDVELVNWHSQQNHPINESSTLLIRGEEVSTRRDDGGVVHLGALGHTTFVPGTGDGARKGYSKESEPKLSESVDLIHKEEGLCFAAHPGEKTSLMQRLFLRRDNWTAKDFLAPIDAFQAVNRDFGKSWFASRKLWVELLLSGRKIPLLAGNDAHGDFNRYRALHLPFIKLKEDFHRYFGNCKTGFYERPNTLTTTTLISLVKEGKTFLTTGPFLDIQVEDRSVIGQTIQKCPLIILAHSNSEFGRISSIKIFAGSTSEKKEYPIALPPFGAAHQLELPLDGTKLPAFDYLRAELMTDFGLNKVLAFAATSPVYLR